MRVTESKQAVTDVATVAGGDVIDGYPKRSGRAESFDKEALHAYVFVLHSPCTSHEFDELDSSVVTNFIYSPRLWAWRWQCLVLMWTRRQSILALLARGFSSVAGSSPVFPWNVCAFSHAAL